VRVTARTSFVLMIAVVFAVLGQVVSVCAIAPSAKISSVTHPEIVSPGLPFDVKVTVDYSDKFLADVGIWDPGAGAMIRSVTLISSFTGPGEADFTFQLTAPKSSARWHLIAMTRVWWQDAWYQDPKGGTMPFDVSILSSKVDVVLSLMSNVPISTVDIDSVSHTLGNAQPVALTLRPGTHTLHATELVSPGEGEQFVFKGWSDGVNSNPRILPLATDSNLTALYTTEYYLTMTSDASQPLGEGWYPAGTVVTFGVIPATYQRTAWFGLLTYDYRFAGWEGDSDSTSNTASVVMDSPKSVSAKWSLSGTQIDLVALGDLLLLATLPLLVRAVYVYRKRRTLKPDQPTWQLRSATKCLVLLCLIIISLTLMIPVHAQLPVQPHATVVKIGDAYWYYWNNTHSDTCILWLGGGISQETLSGYNYYWINPFDYESFGTIHFIQDLTNYYCTIALEKGSYAEIDTAANRTINQELYQIQSTIIADIHTWIRQQGYVHTILMGYSVGGQAAAMEVAIRDPGNWTSADGVVLITVPLENSAIDHARSVNPNLLFLYGGNLPDFVATGQRLYNNAPEEGWQGSHYFHKEFHILNDVGHEVWTVRDSGEYDTAARNIVINFIERSKALQFSSALGSLTGGSAGSWEFNITSVGAPVRVAPGEVAQLDVDVSGATQLGRHLTLLAYDDAEPLSAQSFTLGSGGEAKVNLVIGSLNSTNLQVTVILMQELGGKWSIAAQPRTINVTISNLVTFKLASNVPNLPFIIDGTHYTADQTGQLGIETRRGVHTVSALPIVYDGNMSRLVFVGWEDSLTSTLRQVSLGNDTGLTAFYKKQYYVKVTSPYGTPIGSDWYDENSTATIIVQPPLIMQENLVFLQWTGDATGKQPTITLTVNAPKTVRAEWGHIRSESTQSRFPAMFWAVFSGVAFAAMLIMNVRRRS
jgi:hypothetical protein